MTTYLMGLGCENAGPPPNNIFPVAVIKGVANSGNRRVRYDAPDDWTFMEGKAFISHGTSANAAEQQRIDNIISQNPTKPGLTNLFKQADKTAFFAAWNAYVPPFGTPPDALVKFGTTTIAVIKFEQQQQHQCLMTISKTLFDKTKAIDRDVCYEFLLRFQDENGDDFLLDPGVRNQW